MRKKGLAIHGPCSRSLLTAKMGKCKKLTDHHLLKSAAHHVTILQIRAAVLTAAQVATYDELKTKLIASGL